MLGTRILAQRFYVIELCWAVSVSGFPYATDVFLGLCVQIVIGIMGIGQT